MSRSMICKSMDSFISGSIEKIRDITSGLIGDMRMMVMYVVLAGCVMLIGGDPKTLGDAFSQE